MEIDIRCDVQDKITKIRFWKDDIADASVLWLGGVDSYIADGQDQVYIRSEQHAQNLIKALQKAIDLGNWND